MQIRYRHPIAAILIGLFGATAPAFALTPLQGDEQRLSENMPDAVGSPDIAGNGSQFVVVWSERTTVNGQPDYAIVGRIFDDATKPAQTPAFGVNTDPPAFQHKPRVAMHADGTFAVVWSGESPGDDIGILARRYDADGAPSGAPVLVNSYTTYQQTLPRIAAHPDGGFVVAWQDGNCTGFDPISECGSEPSDGDDTAIRGRRLDATGQPVGASFAVNSVTGGSQTAPALAVNSAGTIFVAWSDEDNLLDGDGSALAARRLDASGAPLGAQFVVNVDPTGDQNEAEVAADSNDGFVVGWGGFGPPKFRRFDSSGAPVGLETVLSDAATNAREFSLRVEGAQLWIAWEENSGAFIQRFNAANVPLGPQFPLSAFLHHVSSPGIVADADGNLVAVRTYSNPFTTNLIAASFIMVVPHCIDDSADTDGDGVGDDCDPCANPGDRTIDIKSKLSLKFIGSNPVLDDDRVTIRGEMLLPPGMVFADIDPMVVPVRLRIETAEDNVILDAVLSTSSYGGAGTAGWQVNGKASRWKFIDKSGDATAGIYSVLVQDRANKAPGQIRMKVKGRDGIYPVVPIFFDDTVPLTATLVFGNPGASECAETVFVAEDCRLTGADTRLSCKR